jgi:amidase
MLSAIAVLLALAAAADVPVQQLIVEGTIADIQRRIVAGETTCAEVVQASLERISAYDDAGLNAITAVARDAMAQARTADRNLRKRAATSPLFCVTVAVKDNIDTADLPTTGGSIALRDSTPPDDAAVVRALRSAGAIVLAKTNMAEWAFSPRRTISSTAGETANAYSLDRVPAGSSGGTASAVAASLALVGLGTDTGNSVRGPSSHLALVGMRATYGRVSLDGVIPLLLDHDAVGPMTRTVEDNARMLSIMAGAGSQLDSLPVPQDYVAKLSGRPLQGARIGVLRALARREAMEQGVATLFDRAIADLRGAGAEVVDDVEIADFGRYVSADPCPRFRADVNLYLRSLGPRAPVTDVFEVFRQGRFAAASREQFARFLNLDADGQPVETQCLPFEQQIERQQFRAAVIAALEHAKIDALVYPTWTYPPALRSRAVEDYRGDNSQLVAPATGLPAITVPLGYTSDVLPAGLQLLGRPWDEATLYALAWQYERLTHHRVAPKLYPALPAPGSRLPKTVEPPRFRY